jgi:NADP-dependent 3-hydroxy acid dehydrogenase YdfG
MPAKTAANKTAVVTGASSGIGAAIVAQLVAAGFQVVAGARRIDKLRAVTEPLGARARGLDVTDTASVEAFAAEIEAAHLLVNNAGLALGLAPVAEPNLDHWRTMCETNVMGGGRGTRARRPRRGASGDGHVINIGSIAGLATYPGGAGYTASKHALRALTETLRQELLGQPVRVTDVAPGLVETEFSIVRFEGDDKRAKSVYQGMTPLSADDVADCVVWAATRPSHVNIDRIQVMPRDQVGATQVHRRSAD